MKSFICFRGEKLKVDSNSEPIDLFIPQYNVIIKNTVLGEGVVIWGNVNIYGAKIGSETKIGSFVEIRSGVEIGERSKIEPFVFIPEGVKIGKGVFIGPRVCFTNDLWPRACDEDGNMIVEYEIVPTFVDDFASIGAGATIVCGINIGKSSLVGAGAVVTSDVPERALVVGVPARVRKFLE